LIRHWRAALGPEAGSTFLEAALQQLAGEAPELALAVSRLSLLECRVAPMRRGDQDCLDRFEALFAQPDLLVVELSASVVELATELRANHGLRTPDALQAACCLSARPSVAGEPDCLLERAACGGPLLA
jgi:predicted nucleic acid-binding protein